MPRTAKPTAALKVPATGKRRGRLSGSVTTSKAPSRTAARRRTIVVAPAPPAARRPVSRMVAGKPIRSTTVAASLPKLSKDELRAQVDKLERANASLRTKNREAGRAAKAAEARIAELEAHVARLEKSAARRSQPAPEPAAEVQRTTRSTRTRRSGLSRDRDPGDAVPPGVAVADPEPLDERAKQVRANLEEHLRPL